MNWMDVLLILLMTANLIRGTQRGFVMTIASMVSYVAGWWAAVVYSGRVSDQMLQSEAFHRPLFQWTRQWLESRSDLNGAAHLVEETLEESWQSLPLPEVAHRWLQQPEKVGDIMENAEAWLLDQAAMALTQLVISFIAFILVFLVVKNLVYFLGLLLNGVFKLPLLNAINRGGGLIAGLIRGLLMIYVMLILLTPLLAADPQGPLATALQESQLLQWVPYVSPGK